MIRTCKSSPVILGSRAGLAIGQSCWTDVKMSPAMAGRRNRQAVGHRASARSRAISTNILDFRVRVLVISGGKEPLTSSDSDPGHGSARPLERRAGPRFSRQSPPDARACRSLWSDGRSALGRQAAASTDGHVSQAADRLASTRARRAAAARDVRSAGTASPVPKYISSGVCPRNAECGSTRLCSST